MKKFFSVLILLLIVFAGLGAQNYLHKKEIEKLNMENDVQIENLNIEHDTQIEELNNILKAHIEEYYPVIVDPALILYSVVHETDEYTILAISHAEEIGGKNYYYFCEIYEFDNGSTSCLSMSRWWLLKVSDKYYPLYYGIVTGLYSADELEDFGVRFRPRS